MSHVARDIAWCVIDINTNSGRVFFQERWQYTWIVADGVSAWTLAEKRRFHHRADNAVWRAWSNKARLRVTGTSDFAKKFLGKELPIDLDIRWVLADPHWSVTVNKIPKGAHVTSFVEWESRKISLDTEDFKPSIFDNGPGKPKDKLIPVAHEFGHTLGADQDDEYTAGSPHLADHRSILNHGNKLRSRHFKNILEEMNKMIADTTFEVGRI